MSFWNNISLLLFTNFSNKNAKTAKRGKGDRNDNQEFQNESEFRRPLLSLFLIITGYADNWISIF